MPRQSLDFSPVLRLTDGTTTIDLLDHSSGLQLADPYWNPQISQLKGGGTRAESPLSDGSTLVFGKRENVIETIPLSIRGHNQDKAIQTINNLLEFLKQASDYWTEPYEFDDIWTEVRPACNDCFTGYARVIFAQIAELTNPFGQPFFSAINSDAVMEDITLVLEREPYWRAIPPGTIIGPLFNLIKNSDFEHWNATTDDESEDELPDNWLSTQSTHISGFIDNGEGEVPSQSGEAVAKVRVSGSTLAGAHKGITQEIANTNNNTTYTAIAWVLSRGVSNGVGRILITYSGQLELYRSADSHGWTLYTGTFTTGVDDTVAMTCEILTTDANTDGTIYLDSFMLIEGDWEQEAIDGVLPYMSSSHIVNHWDQNEDIDAGDLNFVDVWNIPGNVDSLIRLEVMNNTNPADAANPAEVIEFLRVGQRRTRDVFGFSNVHDPAGVEASDVSSGDRIETAGLVTEFQSVTTKIIEADNINDNLGRFRVFARIYDNRASGDPNMSARLRYFQGTEGVNVKNLTPITPLTRGAWTMVDLTSQESMIQDFKFKTSIPSQIGYTVQFSRPSGNEDAYLDYVLTMPTDGGYIEAIISPALRVGDAFTVDNTASEEVGGSHKKLKGFTQVVIDAPSTPQSAFEFKGDLYVGCLNGELVRLAKGESQEQVADYGANAIVAMERYNGRLYIATGLNVYKSDGTTFSAASPEFTIPTGTSISSMKTFRGKLYVGVNGGNGPIYTWDESSVVLSFTTNETNVTSLEVLSNRILAGTDTAAGIYSKYKTSDNWKQMATAADLENETAVTAMTTWIHKPNKSWKHLYVGTSPNAKVFRGSNKRIKERVQDFGTMTQVTAFANPIGRLFAGGTPASPVRVGTGRHTKDWDDLFDAKSFTVTMLICYNGQLIIGGGELGGPTTNIPGESPVETLFKSSEFRGSPFTAPPTKRHRYVFSWDRENSVNAVDDKALIGIGFVPRYFALRGRS